MNDNQLTVEFKHISISIANEVVTNDIEADATKDTTIHTLFEQQVLKTPNAIAVVYEDETLTYAALNEQANQLAHYLRMEMGVGRGDRVGLMIARSTRMIVGLMGILKAGAAYVPIDVRHPTTVITDMLQEASVKGVILDTNFYLSVLNVDAELFLIDDELDDLETSTTNLGETCVPQDLAYVIYTSGSTGKRKGVAVEHHAVVNTLRWSVDYYGFGEADVKLQLPSVAFDSSVIDIFPILISGGRLVLTQEESRMNPRYLHELIVTQSVTNFLITPALYKLLLERLDSQSASTLRSITVAGEATTPSLVQAHYVQLPHVDLINEYGPTENAVCSTACRLDPNDDRVSIGQPITNVAVYILDDAHQPVPVGEKGDLYLAGKGLARGYFNQPALTKDRFIPNPFSASGDAHMYKTGDLGSWRTDGMIDFFGRADNQVKIRGFRIELGEIEQALLQNPAIQDAVVLCTEDDDCEQVGKQLYAFVVGQEPTEKTETDTRTDKETDSAALRNDLQERLPSYMVPHSFKWLDEIPLNVNGKVDHQRLWSLQNPQNSIVATVVPARNTLEAKLVDIWTDALEQKSVGIFNDFFDLGGNSLIAVKAVEGIYQEFGVDLPVVDLYNHNTIAKLATWIDQEM